MAEAAQPREAMKHPWRYRLEYAAARSLVAAVRLLPLALTSLLGGWLARVIGPRLPVSRVARINLARAMPELGPHEIDIIVGDMWDNLGRTAFELTKLERFRLAERAVAAGDIEVAGAENLRELHRSGRGGLLAGAHLANWELQPVVLSLMQIDLHVVYRAANNPLVDGLIQELRSARPFGTVPKGVHAARSVLALLKQGSLVGMLVDQKMNDGIAVPFFGRPAMTAPAIAELARRFDIDILPVRCQRLGGARFRVSFEPPLEQARGGTRQQDVHDTMARLSRVLEDWIRERPAEWLWSHQRWPD